MSKQAYEFTPEMREISGFGGGYEDMCRQMVVAGLRFWDEQGEDFDPRYKGAKGVYGILMNDNEDAKALDKAVLAPSDGGATGAMHQAAVSHIFAVRRLGWRGYVVEMSTEDGPPAGSHAAAALDLDRPYDGQPHTDSGKRGRTRVEGLTYRDVRDCFILACYESSGLPRSKWPTTVYELPWDDMDIIAIAQNLMCEMEKRQGIYPNVPPLEDADA